MFEGQFEESLGPEFVAYLDSAAAEFGEAKALTPPMPIFNENNGGD
jgi:hypothetical protein